MKNTVKHWEVVHLPAPLNCMPALQSFKLVWIKEFRKINVVFEVMDEILCLEFFLKKKNLHPIKSNKYKQLKVRVWNDNGNVVIWNSYST